MKIGIAGATGAVGREMLRTLERSPLPIDEVRPLASERSAGTSVLFRDGSVPVQVLSADAMTGLDVVLFSAGSSVSLEYAPRAVEAGAVVIDNSSAFRMDEGVPLVVPEVNPQAAFEHSGIIANPNCSTVQLVVALEPLRAAVGLERVVVSTYQSASGQGQEGIDALWDQARSVMAGEPVDPGVYGEQLAFNCLPHIDAFLEDGSTREEWKMVVETRKILGLPDLPVHATCVRVPVARGHAEAVWVELGSDLSPDRARALLGAAPGVEVIDDPAASLYPTQVGTDGTDPVWVGRVRRDPSVEHGLAFWCVADNLLKGAALNAVQVAELLFTAR